MEEIGSQIKELEIWGAPRGVAAYGGSIILMKLQLHKKDHSSEKELEVVLYTEKWFHDDKSLGKDSKWYST